MLCARGLTLYDLPYLVLFIHLKNRISNVYFRECEDYINMSGTWWMLTKH